MKRLWSLDSGGLKTRVVATGSGCAWETEPISRRVPFYIWSVRLSDRIERQIARPDCLSSMVSLLQAAMENGPDRMENCIVYVSEAQRVHSTHSKAFRKLAMIMNDFRNTHIWKNIQMSKPPKNARGNFCRARS